MTESRKDALTRLEEDLGIREPFLLLTGDAGTGKTQVARQTSRRWGARARVAFVANPALTRTELVEEIVRRFGIEPPQDASKPQLLACLEQLAAESAAENKTPVIVVDDAHDLTVELLGELRLLANAMSREGRSVEVLLVGLPQLETLLEDDSLVPLRQRIAARLNVSAFTPSETRRFLQEIVAPSLSVDPAFFTRRLSRDMHKEAGGTARALKMLAMQAVRRERAAETHPLETERAEPETPAQGTTRDAATEPAASGDAAAPPERTARGIASGSERAGSTEREATMRPTPSAEPSAPPPAVPARSDAADPSSPDTPYEPAFHRTPLGSPELRGGDPRVSKWVERFIAPDEPRFGSLLMRSVPTEEEAASLDALDEPRGEVGSRGRPLSRRGRRNAAWATPVAIGLLIVAAIGTVIVFPRTRALFSGAGAAQNATMGDEARVATPSVDRESSAVPEAPDGDASTPSSTPAGDDARSTPQAATETHATPEPHETESPGSPTGQLYALDVGTFPDEYTAQMERERLTAPTGLQGWVIPLSEDGGISYRVVLGIYSTPDRAEKSARLLFEGYAVSNAKVIPLPPRSERR